MATCLEIITDALVEASEIGFGVTPAAEESDRALNLLQGMYDEWVNGGSFGRLNDTIPSTNYTAKEQDRVVNDGYTITLPATVVDSYSGVTRPPLDLSLIVVVETGAARQVSIYDANQADWVRLDALALTDDAPLSDRGRQGLSCLLAKRWAGNRVAISEQSEIIAGRFLSNLTRKQSAARREGQADYF